jgi:hypothetical protein
VYVCKLTPARARVFHRDNSHLFNLGGLAAVIHGDRLWIGNNNNDATNCAEGYDLGANGTAPRWPVNTFQDLTFNVNTNGKIVSLEMGGQAATIATPTPGLPVAAGCKPLNIPPIDGYGYATRLFIGASGNPNYNDNFCGSITSFSISPTSEPAV